jgi:hypothetical protein
MRKWDGSGDFVPFNHIKTVEYFLNLLASVCESPCRRNDLLVKHAMLAYVQLRLATCPSFDRRSYGCGQFWSRHGTLQAPYILTGTTQLPARCVLPVLWPDDTYVSWPHVWSKRVTSQPNTCARRTGLLYERVTLGYVVRELSLKLCICKVKAWKSACM